MVEYNERVATVSTDIVLAVRDILTTRGVDYAEYQAALRWIQQLVEAGELRMFIDNFFERTVETATFAGRPGSEGTVQGPYYVPGSKLLTEKPFVIPMREHEAGDPLVLTGQIADLDGNPLPGALVDMWHAGNDGTYSGFVGDVPAMNLRARMHTDEEGRFQIRTIRPAPYQIPTGGPVGRYLEMLGRHAWRPAHFHLKISVEGFEPLTTQIYFRGGEWLDGDGDVSGAVKDSLIVEVFEDKNEEVARVYGLSLPFLATTTTFRLRPSAAR